MRTGILRLPCVLDMTGMSRSWVYAEIAQGRFPPPLKLGLRAIGWMQTDIEAWLNSRERRT